MRHPGKEEEEGGLCQGSLLARARLVSQVRCGGHVCYHDGVTPGPGRGMGHRTPGFLEEAHVTSPDAISSPCCWAELCRAGQNPRVHPRTQGCTPTPGPGTPREARVGGGSGANPWAQPGEGMGAHQSSTSLPWGDGIPGNHPAGLATHPSTGSWEAEA